jgi:diacylglycerol kinase (ATP)
MTDKNKNIALLVNPTSVNKKAMIVSKGISEILQLKMISHFVFDKQWPGTLEEFTEAWIVGGDGTMNWFVNNYPDVQCPLAIFPGGTGNDFHWMLYGKMNLDQQVELVLNASAKKLDAGTCNGRLFLNGVGIGFDGAIVKDLAGKKKLGGKASYLISILKHIIRYREKNCVIEINGERFEQDCFMISVANARRYGGGFIVAPNSSVTDGLLDLNIVGEISPLQRIRYLPVMEKGGHLHLPFIRHRQVASVKITSFQSFHAHLDGEYLCASHFDIQVLPGRFSFLC